MLNRSKILFSAILLVLAGSVAVASLKGGPDAMKAFELASGKKTSVVPLELSKWIVTGKRDFVVLDLRDDAAYKKGHVRGAIQCGNCHAGKKDGRAFLNDMPEIDFAKKVVVYTQSDKEPVKLPKVMVDNPRLFRLAGGYQAWENQVLKEVKVEAGDSEAAVMAKRKRAAVRNMFLGKSSAGAATPMKIKPIRRARTHSSQPEDEGC